MISLVSLRTKAAGWRCAQVSIFAALAAFCCYTSMYAFRKSFAAGVFEESELWGIDYKVWLVMLQMVGYMCSKFYGIRFISESKSQSRAKYLLVLIGISWLGLLGFAVIPAPYNMVSLVINGFPLGMIWGLVFSYLEGRKGTEFMGAVMSVSLIFASGFVKTVGRTLIDVFHISEFWMPFFTGLVFLVPFLISVLCLEMIPPPSAEDQRLRTLRIPMNRIQRRSFMIQFLPGIIITIFIYVMLTVLRDVCDNFEVEIWQHLHVKDNHIYTKVDAIIAVVILALMSLLILVKDNLRAFSWIHVMILIGFVTCGIATYSFDRNMIDGVTWMTLVGLGLYMAYIPYNAIFFERMIANFNVKGNVGFVMYLADSIGYLGSFSLLMLKETGPINISWAIYFSQLVYIISILGAVCAVASLMYFVNKTISRRNRNTVRPSDALDSRGQLQASGA